jgi:hypothetical protein
VCRYADCRGDFFNGLWLIEATYEEHCDDEAEEADGRPGVVNGIKTFFADKLCGKIS